MACDLQGTRGKVPVQRLGQDEANAGDFRSDLALAIRLSAVAAQDNPALQNSPTLQNNTTLTVTHLLRTSTLFRSICRHL
jgi:hypothetical protein